VTQNLGNGAQSRFSHSHRHFTSQNERLGNLRRKEKAFKTIFSTNEVFNRASSKNKKVK
jgi:hypothetical protein